jgi:uncharacterized protein YegL
MDDKYLRRHREELNASSAVVTTICIVVDTSFSMARYRDKNGKTRMDRLNEGIHQFLEEIKNDDILADSVEIAIVTFNTVAGTALAFSTIENIEGMTIAAGNTAGDTPKGVEKALEILENEKNFLKANGKRYNQPWIVIMSDGRATASYNKETGTKDQDDVDRRLIVAQNKTKYLEAQDKLTVIPVLISEISDGEYQDGKRQMQGFTNSNRCKEIGDAASQVSFRDFFKVLSRSVSVSNADLLFADASAASNVRRSDRRPVQRDDYITQDEVVRMIRRTPTPSVERIIEPTVPVIEPTDANKEELDEVERLRSESLQPSLVEDAPPEDEYEKETDDFPATSVLTDARMISKPVSIVTKPKATDDSYLESLLAGLDDWDDI